MSESGIRRKREVSGKGKGRDRRRGANQILTGDAFREPQRELHAPRGLQVGGDSLKDTGEWCGKENIGHVN